MLCKVKENKIKGSILYIFIDKIVFNIKEPERDV